MILTEGESKRASALKRDSKNSHGLKIQSHFVKAGEDPYAQVEWSRRESRV